MKKSQPPYTSGKCKLSVLLLMLLSPFLCFSQSEEELLRKLPDIKEDTDRAKIYVDLHNAVFKTNIPKTKEYGEKILLYAQRSNSLYYQYVAYRALAGYGRRSRNYPVVLHYDSLALFVAQKIDSPMVQYHAHIQIATDYLDDVKMEAALPHLQVSAAIADSLNNLSAKAKVQNRLGWYYNNIFQYSAAVPHFNNALETYRQLGDKRMIANTERGYAGVLFQLGRQEGVAEMLEEAITYLQSEKKTEDLAQCLVIMAQVYLQTGNFEKAIATYSEIKNLFHASPDYKTEEGGITLDIATTYLARKNLSLAYQYGMEAQALINSLPNPDVLTAANTFWGTYYTLSRNLEKADSCFAKAAQLARMFNIRDRETENMHYWARVKFLQNKNREGDSLLVAYIDRVGKERDPAAIREDMVQFIKSNGLRDSTVIDDIINTYKPGGSTFLKQKLRKIHQANLPMDSLLVPYSGILTYQENTAKKDSFYQELIDIDARYRMRQKNDTIEAARKERELAIQNNLKQSVIIWLSMCLLVLVSAGFWLQYRHRRRAENDKEQIELLQNEIHHRVKNNLAVVNRLVDVANKSSIQDEALAALKNRLKSIELIHRHLYSQEAAAGNILLQLYFEDLCASIADAFKTDKIIRIITDAPVEVKSAIAEKLGLIINELVTNSLKYAFSNRESGIIRITARPDKKRLHISVQDDGIGLETSKTSKRYGMKLIKGLSHGLNGTLSFQSVQGTRFDLYIPQPVV